MNFRYAVEKIETFVTDLSKENRHLPKDIVARSFLFVLSRLFRSLVQCRLSIYQQRIFRYHTLGCLVVSIGNLTVGGTGKTPVVEVFSKTLEQNGRKVAILSRGYRNKGKPFLEKLVDLKADGSFALNMDYFTYPYGLTMTGKAFETLFGIKRRRPEEQLEQVHMDIAASIQVVTEKMVHALARHARELTGKDKLCLAGGVALNCVANGKILREGLFDDVWIQPAAGDAGR